MNPTFPPNPSITFFDPLAELLGVGDGLFPYCFDDVVKLSGHACPTVAGAFLMTVRAMRELYGDETPVRGGIRIGIPGAEDQGVNGPISQVICYLTGAAARNGFQGLGGQFSRRGLMGFDSEPAAGFGFERLDTGARVGLRYDPSSIPPDPAMMPLMQLLLQGEGGPAGRRQFQDLWRGRVIRILEDAGERTLSLA